MAMKLMILISRASKKDIKKCQKDIKNIENISDIKRYNKRYRDKEINMRNNINKGKRVLALVPEESGKLNREYLSIGSFMERITKNNSNEKGESI